MSDFELKTDEEKAEQIKAWWKENGLTVVLGISLAFGGMFGWQYWQNHKTRQAEAASNLYSAMSDENRSQTLETLNKDFGSTPYAALAGIKSSKTACASENLEECIALLKSAANSDSNLKDIIELRLARVLLAKGDINEAESLINKERNKAYDSLTQELKGDLLVKKNQLDEAKTAYDRAILEAGTQDTRYLKMKRDNLGFN